MKKNLFSALLLFVLCAALTLSVSASGNEARLIDAAGLLSEEEASALLADLNAASDQAKFDIVVITMTSLEGTNVEDAAQQLYDYYQYGYGEGDEKTYDGALFLISMQERETAIDAYGIGQYVLDRSAQDQIFDAVIPYLSAGNYYEGFETFASLTEQLVIRARGTGSYDNYYDDPAAWGITDEGHGYDDYGYEGYGYGGNGYTMEKAPFSAGLSIFVGLLISMLIAAISTGSMKSQLKSVQQKSAASDYVRRDSLNLTENRENYLYSNVARIPRAQARSNPPRPSGGGNVRPSGSNFRPSAGGHTSSSHKF